MLASEKLIQKNGTAITIIDFFSILISRTYLLIFCTNYCLTFSKRDED